LVCGRRSRPGVELKARGGWNGTKSGTLQLLNAPNYA
jgi:hypothetical protein